MERGSEETERGSSAHGTEPVRVEPRESRREEGAQRASRSSSGVCERDPEEQAAERDSKGAQRAKRGLLVIIMTKAPGKHPFNLLAYRHAVVPTIHTTYDTTTNRL